MSSTGNAAVEAERTGRSRRSFLRNAVGTVGVVGAGTGRTVGRSDDRVEIVTHRTRGEVARTAEVPAAWYHQKERAKRVKDRLAERYRDAPGVLGVYVRPGEATIGGLREFAVSVHVDEETGTGAALPASVDGVPVGVERRGPRTPVAYEHDYDPIPGGVFLTTTDGNVTRVGSSFGEVEWNGTRYLMTARHVFVSGGGACSSEDPAGTDAYQNHDYYGQVSEDFPDYDAALTTLDPNGTRSAFSNTIVDQQGEVAGYVAAGGVDRMIGNAARVTQKRGIGTGATTGHALQYGTDHCWGDPDLDDLLVVSNQSLAGDSGGPVYETEELDDGSLVQWMVAITNGVNSEGQTIGSMAHAMASEHNVDYYTP